MSDFAKFDRPGQLHIAFQALDKFQSSVGRLPGPYNKEDALKFVEIAKETNNSSPCKVVYYDYYIVEICRLLGQSFTVVYHSLL